MLSLLALEQLTERIKMKKKPKNTLVAILKEPPPGWPTEKEWKVIEKKLSKQLPALVRENMTPAQQLKHDICAEFIKYFNKNKLTQKQLAKVVGINEARMSEILHYHFDRFTVDLLVKYLMKIKPDLKIKVA